MAVAGRIAKSSFKVSGLFIVLQKLTEASYLVHKLPFVAGAGHREKSCKVNSKFVAFLPSPPLRSQAMVDSTDSRFAQLKHMVVSNPVKPTQLKHLVVSNPLKLALTVSRFGDYVRA